MRSKTNPEFGSYSVTMNARQVIHSVSQSPGFEENDSVVIYSRLREKLKPLDFSFYLKRFVHRAAGYDQAPEEVPTDAYVDTITTAFDQRGVPASITPGSTRLRAACRNWLKQKTVSREVVVLLAFGLGMNLEETNGFLTKALQESSLNPKDPMEAICWYCLEHRLGYYSFRQILSEYEQLPGSVEKDEISTASTQRLRIEFNQVRDQNTLIAYLNRLRSCSAKSHQSVEARQSFDRLYREAREIIAEFNNSVEKEKNEIETERLREALSRNDQLYEEQKQKQIQNLLLRRKKWTASDITPVHFEEVLYSAIPKDRNGNMLPMKGSALNDQFRGKRLNRQHIQDILDGSGTISRYDLATMSFFAQCRLDEKETNQIDQYHRFLNETNGILNQCGMGSLYEANPYEAFLMMCMLTDYPLGTYADVWEMSFVGDDSESAD